VLSHIAAGGEFTSRSSLPPAGNGRGANESQVHRLRLVFSQFVSHHAANSDSRPGDPVDIELTWPPSTVNHCQIGHIDWSRARRYRV